jgi:heme O synthase-like polyprenyltransferase
MTAANVLMGILIAFGFFVSAAVGRLFHKSSTGIVIGGVVGLAVSVVVFIYGLNNVFDFGAAVVEN